MVIHFISPIFRDMYMMQANNVHISENNYNNILNIMKNQNRICLSSQMKKMKPKLLIIEILNY